MIVNCQRRIPVAVQPLARFLEEVRRALCFPSGGVTVRLMSDNSIARLNRAFRGKRGPTDVLSFPARPRRTRPSGIPRNGPRPQRGADQGYVGDIAISPETARRNARSASRGLPAELRILILHGMIHLAGYDHETDHGEMEKFERKIRRRLGLR